MRHLRSIGRSPVRDQPVRRCLHHHRHHQFHRSLPSLEPLCWKNCRVDLLRSIQTVSTRLQDLSAKRCQSFGVLVRCSGQSPRRLHHRSSLRRALLFSLKSRRARLLTGNFHFGASRLAVLSIEMQLRSDSEDFHEVRCVYSINSACCSTIACSEEFDIVSTDSACARSLSVLTSRAFFTCSTCCKIVCGLGSC